VTRPSAAGVPGNGPSPADVFLNIPFDRKREYLYLSLIASIVAVGLNPRSVVEVPVDASRLDRLFALVRSCRYSLHDLSAVEVTAKPFRVPRFNMPFELGLAAALHLQDEAQHSFRLLEAVQYRLDQSLGDMKGYDVYIHHADPKGVFRAVRNMFAKLPGPPMTAEREFLTVYETLRSYRHRDRNDPYEAVYFASLVTAARAAVEQRTARRQPSGRHRSGSSN
jgi:hypothetical protein